MFRRQYTKIRIGNDRLEIIDAANRLIESYKDQGMGLTLRQLYYRFIAQDLLPASWADETGTKNIQRNYKRLGDVISDGRMAGLIDWEGLEDRTRELEAVAHWDSPADIIRSCQRSFRLDKWNDQKYRIECWVEKDALEGIVKQAAHSCDTAAFSCRGYTSLSSMWAAARRLFEYVKAGQRPVILHLGDHDPSGINMTEDIRGRLNDFVETDWLYEEMPGITTASSGDIWQSMEDRFRKYGRRRANVFSDSEVSEAAQPIQVVRIALTRAQIDQYEPPPNPAKAEDPRFKSYQAQHGDESWELDALEPSVLNELIIDSINMIVDHDKYDDRFAEEKIHRSLLDTAATRWNDGVSAAISKLASKPVKVKAKAKKDKS